MFKTLLTTAFVVVSMGLALPSVALASPEDDFRDRCLDAGGTFSNGQCKYPDGSTEQCTFGEDEWGCYRDTPPRATLTKNFGKLVNIPVKIAKKPTPPGPVEIDKPVKAGKLKSVTSSAVTFEKAEPSSTVESTQTFTTRSMVAAPIEKMELSSEVITFKLAR